MAVGLSLTERCMFMEHSMYIERIINIETGEETWRDYTPAEIEEVERAQAEAAELFAKQVEAEAKKQALLDRLGITAEEARLLLS